MMLASRQMTAIPQGVQRQSISVIVTPLYMPKQALKTSHHPTLLSSLAVAGTQPAMRTNLNYKSQGES
jgi:hypothetical protein